MKKMFSAKIITFLFIGVLLAGCSEEAKSSKEGENLEALSADAVSSVLEEYPELEKNDIESIVAEVTDITPFKNDQMTVTNKNVDTQETFIVRIEKEKYPSLEEGQTILLVTPKLQRESNPPIRDVLELIRVNN